MGFASLSLAPFLHSLKQCAQAVNVYRKVNITVNLAQCLQATNLINCLEGFYHTNNFTFINRNTGFSLTQYATNLLPDALEETLL